MSSAYNFAGALPSVMQLRHMADSQQPGVGQRQAERAVRRACEVMTLLQQEVFDGSQADHSLGSRADKTVGGVGQREQRCKGYPSPSLLMGLNIVTPSEAATSVSISSAQTNWSSLESR